MFWLVACLASPPGSVATPGVSATLGEPDVTLSGISTVFTVQWSSADPDIGWVEFGNTAAYGHATPADPEPTTDHHLQVAGLAGNSEQHWRIVEQQGEALVYGPDHTLQTDGPTINLRMEMDQPPDDWNGYFLAALDNLSAVAIYNGRGQPVWWLEMEGGAMMSQARMFDGKIWFNQFSKEDEGPDIVRSVALDFSTDTVLELPDSHHDFLLFDDRIMYLARDKRVGPDGQDWIGDKLMQYDNDGTTTQLWTSWDSISTEVVSDSFYDDGRDWIHSNGLGYWEEQHTYLITSKTQQALFAVDDAGGGLQWIMGGVQNDMEHTVGDGFGVVHGPLYADGRLWLFDNGPKSGKEPSQAQAYTVDPANHTCAEVWSYSEGKKPNLIHGDVEPLPDGTIMAAWGEQGFVVWLDESGTVLGHWSGPQLGYVHWLPTLGGPIP